MQKKKRYMTAISSASVPEKDMQAAILLEVYFKILSILTTDTSIYKCT